MPPKASAANGKAETSLCIGTILSDLLADPLSPQGRLK